MARKHHRPAATAHRYLGPVRPRCWACGGPLWMAYHANRTVATLDNALLAVVTAFPRYLSNVRAGPTGCGTSRVARTRSSATVATIATAPRTG